MSVSRATTVLTAIERCRRRLWGHRYRMTGRRTEADDLCQEAIARAIERADDLHDDGAADGWLFRIATTMCLDHLRRERRARALTELVDPVAFDDVPAPPADPETTAPLRDDVRLAVVAPLQHLAPKQRAVLLHAVFVSIHVETRAGRIVAMRVVRDPAKLVALQEVMQ